MRFSLPGSEVSVVDIAPHEKKSLTVFIPARKRGLLSPAELTISTLYPFGLFGMRINYFLDTDCFVYPKPISTHLLTVQDLLAAHSDEGNRFSSADDFKGLRTFQNGDPVQHIFWKAFSKGQGLMIKEFVGAESPAIFFSYQGNSTRSHKGI